MARAGWVSNLRGLATRVLLATAACSAIFGAIGLALGGWDGLRNGVMWGVLGGGLSIPFVLGAMVDESGGGASPEMRQEYFRRQHGIDVDDA